MKPVIVAPYCWSSGLPREPLKSCQSVRSSSDRHMPPYACQIPVCNTKIKPYAKDLGDSELSVWLSLIIRNEKKCPCVVWDLAEEGGCACGEQEVYEKLLNFMLNFAVNPKLPPKMIFNPNTKTGNTWPHPRQLTQNLWEWTLKVPQRDCSVQPGLNTAVLCLLCVWRVFALRGWLCPIHQHSGVIAVVIPQFQSPLNYNDSYVGYMLLIIYIIINSCRW